jgi:hypothetical protein
MRPLNQITAAIRSGQPFTEEEARYAVVAYDVLIARLSVDLDPVRLAEYFKAAESSPAEYVGWKNDPQNADAIEWYRAMGRVGEKCPDVGCGKLLIDGDHSDCVPF